MTDQIRLLIVEDVDTDAELIQRELKRSGVSFHARCASTREEFLAAVDAELPELVLSDFNLPCFSGMDVVHEVAARSKTTPVIIVTGSLSEETAAACIREGAVDYVLKENLARLGPAVHGAIELRRLRIEEELSRIEIVRARDFYLSLVEDFPNPVWRSGPDGRIDFVNRAWLELTGCTLEHELGDGWFEGIHPDDRARTASRWLAANETKTPFFAEFRLRTADGSYRWIANYGRPYSGLDGSFSGYIGSSFDVQAAHDLQERSESHWRFLESVLGHLDSVVYVLDDAGVVLFANEAAARLRGIPPGALIGRNMREFPYISEEYREAYERARRTRERVRCERMTIPTLKGERRVYDGWLIPFTGPDGSNVLISSLNDITARVDAEATNSLLAAAVEHAAESVVITDGTGTIEYVNPAFTLNTGFAASEVVGQSPKLLQSGRHDRAFYENLWATISSGQHWQGEFVNRRKDGSFFREAATISPVPDASGRIAHFVGVKRDLSREADLEERLAHSQKLDAVGRLAGGIAHDFNNLLGVIGGYAEMLAQSLGDDHPGQERVAQMRKATERAAALTRQLLAFGRKQVLQPRVIDLNQLVEDSRELLRQLLREPIALEIVPAQAAATVFVDRSQMEQVIFNLAVNSRDAMPNGGTLRIELAILEIDSDSSSIRDAIEPGRWVRLTVSDTGTGIPHDKLSRIFEPFFTTRSDSGGIGLGLATVYGIVRQSGGNIAVTTAPDKGTSFRIYLPVADGAGAGANTVPAAPASRREARPATILIAEDVDLLREMLREGLEAEGMTVLEARDGEEALRVSRKEAGAIDLLLTDVVMPKMSGRELGDRIRAERPDLRVLFMSGYTGDIIASAGVVEDGVELLQKPFSIETLVERIHRLIGAER